MTETADSHTSSTSVDLEAIRKEANCGWPDGRCSANHPLILQLVNEVERLQRQLAAQTAVAESALPVYGWYHRHVIRAHSVNPDAVTLPTSLLTPIWTALRPHYDPDAAIARLDAADVPAAKEDQG